MKPVTMIVVGAGGRGSGYAQFALEHPDQAQVVGVAEPKESHRNRLAEAHQIPARNVFADWKKLAARKKFADAVLICTQDRMHVEPAIRFAKKGYHILLEKPMALDARDCKRIVAAVEKAGVMFAVCHVLRYTGYTQKLKGLVASGVIGDIVNIQHMEPVGYWHMAHSYVRGNWRNQSEACPMLLSKSCHDMDWIRYIMGCRCLKVSSFASLKHFRKECKPAGAAARCLDCPAEAQCAYSAKKIYLGRLAQGVTGWPVDVLSGDVTVEGLTKALREGPYGRCVYECDNDVVDNQVVSMEFEGGRTATFTMTAFAAMADRKTHVFGTKGHLYGDGKTIEHYDFLTDATTTIDTVTDAAHASHGGGDYGLMKSFTAAIANNDTGRILSGPRETLETHMMVFMAEKARKENRVIAM